MKRNADEKNRRQQAIEPSPEQLPEGTKRESEPMYARKNEIKYCS